MDDALNFTTGDVGNIQQPESPDGSRPAGSRPRKRTKTGCLTCRKRRIKCGEERPICANCVKSKRNCEGYAPRLTFKDPMGSYAPGWPDRGYAPVQGQVQYMQQPMAATGHPQFALIAPRPIPEQAYYGTNYQAHPSTAIGTVQQHPQHVQQLPQDIDNLQHYTHQHLQEAFQQQQQHSQGPPPPTRPAVATTSSESGHIQWISSESKPIYEPVHHQSHHLPTTVSHDPQQLAAYPTIKREESPPEPNEYEPRLPDTSVFPSTYLPVASHSIGTFQSLPPDWHEKTPPPYSNPPPVGVPQEQYHDHPYLQHPAMAQLHEDGEYYDVDSDEEMQDVPTATVATIEKRRRDLHHVLAISGQGRNLRTVEAFLNQPNVLTTYAPKFSTSPLMDEATARIFCHFVTVTGPLLSAYGRHPVNPALLFSGVPVPKSQQALWTYTIPMMAISNQALLHAILALASLNIARLQQTPLTVPIKHYQFALRRVAKAVATPGRRTAMATVAATILLSQFEILSAEYSKWHSHLAGARQLLTEINFAQWTDRIHEEKARRAIQGCDHGHRVQQEELPWIPEPGSESEKILNQLIGTSIRKDFHGKTQRRRKSISSQPMTEKEQDDFQTYRDLFWMYTKIDNIQSFVSGRRLLLPFDRWIHCPPRAPMNRFDAVYGTLDHISLLLGRVADFAGKDVMRKRKAVKANGGVWRPSPGMFGPLNGGPPTTMPPRGMGGMLSPPGAAPIPHLKPQEAPNHGLQVPTPSASGSQPSTPGQGPPNQPQGPPSGPPTFSGLFPSESQPSETMPDAFSQAPRDVLYHPAQNDTDIELTEATATAQAEWNSIQEAFDIFEQALGPAFKPLSPDAGPIMDTPFGPAIQYRTFQIAVGWLLFYMAKIISIRTHPAMPPASMVAAGVAAAKTAQYCNMIGRINFGLQTPAPHQPLNPIFGGAITEMMLPMFVAGVQYMDNAQRVATVERLQFIADRIGHDSAAIIAAGLEKTWIRLYEAGRGPPYKPSVRIQDEYGRDLNDYERSQYERDNGEIRVPRGPARDFDGKEAPKNQSRGAVILQKDTRSFAAGVMGLEDNFGNLNMDDASSGRK